MEIELPIDALCSKNELYEHFLALPISIVHCLSQYQPTETMPTTEEITVQEQVIKTARAVLQRRASYNAYKYEIKKYKDWAGKLDPVKNGRKYLTRDNVDLYISEVQKDHLVTVNM